MGELSFQSVLLPHDYIIIVLYKFRLRLSLYYTRISGASGGSQKKRKRKKLLL